MNKFFELDQLKTIEFDITSYCNSGCPICVRHEWGTSKPHKELELGHLKKETIFTVADEVNDTVQFNFNGVLGDSMMHPDILEIVNYTTSKGIRTHIETNGGSRNEKLWAELGKVKNLSVQFSIDGLADTNFIYRIKTDFNKIINNAKAFINAGGNANWKFIVFQHNQHQVETARKLAKDLGFKKFTTLDSVRFLESEYVIDKKYYKHNKEANNQDYVIRPADKVKEKLSHYLFSNVEKAPIEDIDCKSIHRRDMFIAHNGTVWPCCFFESLKYHKGFKDFYKTATDLYGEDFNNLYKNPSFKSIFYNDFFQQFLNKDWTSNQPNKICSTKCGRKVKSNDWKTKVNKNYEIINS
jgi:MoaA/NifB/PqqE/SkfB family radical SAM enzyme